jgi:hypothetical protein
MSLFSAKEMTLFISGQDINDFVILLDQVVIDD